MKKLLLLVLFLPHTAFAEDSKDDQTWWRCQNECNYPIIGCEYCDEPPEKGKIPKGGQYYCLENGRHCTWVDGRKREVKVTTDEIRELRRAATACEEIKKVEK